MTPRILLLITSLFVSMAGASAADAQPHGIIMFGDSCTAERPGSVQKVYAVRVQEALEGIGSSVKVRNAGLGGNTTANARQRFTRDVLQHQPRLVVFQFGINDSCIDVWKTPPATTPRVSLIDYIANLRAMIAEARTQKAAVILMTPNPLRWTAKLKSLYGKPPYRPDAEDGMDAPQFGLYNDALRKLAKELSVPLVDIHAAYPDFAAKQKKTISGLLLDGMHPNDLGHQLVCERLLPAIRAVLD